VLLDISRDTFL